MFEQPASTDSVTSAARRSFIKTIAAGAALGSVGSLFPSVVRAQRAETIKIGFVVPLTGPYASEAQAEVKGAELALKDRAYVMDQGSSCITTMPGPCSPTARFRSATAPYRVARARVNQRRYRIMPIGKLDHYSIRTVDLDASRRFYTQVMGFHVGFRPPFDFPGLWLYNEETYPDSYGVVHIIGIDPSNPQGLKEYLGDRDPSSLKGTGTVDHMAFRATGLQQMRARLSTHEVAHRERSVPSLGLHQVFFEDPSGVTIELNYPADEAQAV